VEEAHITDIIEQLIETDMLIGHLFTLFLKTNPTSLNIPSSDWNFFFFYLHSSLLKYAFQKSSLPPTYSFPYEMTTN